MSVIVEDEMPHIIDSDAGEWSARATVAWASERDGAITLDA